MAHDGVVPNTIDALHQSHDVTAETQTWLKASENQCTSTEGQVDSRTTSISGLHPCREQRFATL